MEQVRFPHEINFSEVPVGDRRFFRKRPCPRREVRGGHRVSDPCERGRIGEPLGVFLRERVEREEAGGDARRRMGGGDARRLRRRLLRGNGGRRRENERQREREVAEKEFRNHVAFFSERVSPRSRALGSEHRFLPARPKIFRTRGVSPKRRTARSRCLLP